MIVKIFGNSITNHKRFNHQPLTFVDIIERRYNSRVDIDTIYRSRARCSEERILYFLKKFKKIDVAIIFHAYPTHEFCPGCTDDFDHGTVDDEDLEYMTNNNIKRHFFENVTEKIPMRSDLTTHTYDAITTKNILDSHRRFHYNIDLQMNRYQGALVLIDQYLTAKSIKAIHCIHKEYMPTWFKFSSGMVIHEFSE